MAMSSPRVRAQGEARRHPFTRALIVLALSCPAAVGGMRAHAAGAGSEAVRSGGPAATWSIPREGRLAAGQRLMGSEVARMRAAADLAGEYGVPLELADRITRAATEAGVHPRVAFRLVQTESSFRRTAVSSAGAVGLTQVLPSTASWLEPGTTRSDLFRPDTNLRLGFRYLHYLLDRYDGDLRLALTAYNRGPGTVDGILDRGRDPENGYATHILGGRRSS